MGGGGRGRVGGDGSGWELGRWRNLDGGRERGWEWEGKGKQGEGEGAIERLGGFLRVVRMPRGDISTGRKQLQGVWKLWLRNRTIYFLLYYHKHK